MIQRIQSLYLMVVAVLMTIMLFTPMASLTATESVDAARFDVWGIHFANGNSISLLYFGILVGLTGGLSLAIVMLYKKRKLQLQLCYALEVLLIGVLVFELFYGYQLFTTDGYTVDFSPILLLPLFSIPLVWLASRGIIKDIALLKSYDRVR
ncbi:MAG: DUF4293 domain-containing protein [Mucinivorans sp.]